MNLSEGGADKGRNPVKSLEEKLDISEDKEIEEKVKSTKSLIQTFLQTLKAFRLYEANHPILSKFLERLRKDFDQYFGEFDSFSLQVGEHRLYYRGNIVYENEDVKESLAFVFFKDGIREIQFSKGLEFKEMIDFLNVVRKGDLLNRMEDDLVTLLWEKDFSHITFTAVDEFLEGGATLVPATEEDLIKGSEYKGSLEDGLQEKVGQAESPSLPVREGLDRAINPAPGQSLVQACQLTPEEREAIDREARQEEQPDYIFTLINNLIEILLHLGEDVDAYENMISYFDRVIEYLLEQKEVGKAVALLSSLNETMDSIMMKDRQIFAIQRILQNSSGPHSVELLGKAMKGNGEAHSESESILEYLRLLTMQAVEPLCLLLGEMESGKWRKTICDRLIALCREGIQPLSKFLSNDNPMLVCHILYILGNIGDPSTVNYLGDLATHKDLKVREETLQILNKFGENGKDLMQRFLLDSVSAIRSKAALLLARNAKGESVKPLTEIILSEDFFKRDYKEKASFFRALGETGSKEVIPILEGISKKRRLFQREKWNEMRQCAVNTLKMLGA